MVRLGDTVKNTICLVLSVLEAVYGPLGIFFAVSSNDVLTCLYRTSLSCFDPRNDFLKLVMVSMKLTPSLKIVGFSRVVP